MVDYSKWSKIEVSDDEDDTHPNIDTPSLFRWRHQARIERMNELDQKLKDFQDRKKNCIDVITKTKKQMDEFKSKNPDAPVTVELKNRFEESEKKLKEIENEEALLNKEVKAQPLNVDTLSKPKYSRTLINQIDEKAQKLKNPEDITKNLKKFADSHKKEAQHFAMLSRSSETIEYLTQHPYLATEEAANYLCIWCIDLTVEDKISLMERVAKQVVSLQFLLELAETQKTYPRDLIRLFFSRFDSMTGEHLDSFNTELEAFKERVKDRAKARIDEATAQLEVEERQKRLGPGGLDPVEVMETLPTELKECFEKRDIELLKSVLTSMDPQQAEYHFKRCIESGLWMPGAESADDDEENENIDATSKQNAKSSE